MRRPLVPIAVAFISGILLNEWVDADHVWLWIGAAGAIIVALLSLLTTVRNSIRVSCVLMLVCIVAMNFAHFRTRHLEPNHLLRFLGAEKKISKVRCRVVDHPLVRRDEPLHQRLDEDNEEPLVRTTCTVEVEEIHTRTGTLPCTGLTRLTIHEQARDLAYGDEVLVSGFLSRPPPAQNPGQFDYRQYLAREGIHATLTAPLRGNVQVLKHGCGNRFWAGVYARKRRMEDFIFANYPEPQASVLSCILLGNRGSVPKKIEEAFQRTGTVHILSVSGLHMAMLAGSLWFCLQYAGVRRRPAALLVLAFVAYYAALTGATAPPVRAGVMAAVACLGVILARQQQLMNSLALAALVILLLNPNEVFDVGFQLSFLCVLGIGLFYAPILNILPGRDSPLDELETARKRRAWFWIRRNVRKCVAVSAAAQLATAPLVAFHFHLVTPLAALFNVVVIPVAWLTQVTGMISATAAGSPAGSGTVTWGFVQLVQLISWTPGCAFYVAGPSVAWMLAYFLFLGATIWRERLRLNLARLVILALCLAILPVCWWLFTPSRKDFNVTCLAVGHGNSVLLQFPGAHDVLYDCGTLGNYDVGKNVVAKYLWHEGITRLDAVVFSHPHFDHVSGFPSLAERIHVRRLIVSPRFAEDSLGRTMVQIAQRRGTEVQEVAAGDIIWLGDVAAVRVMHPPARIVTTRLLDTNERSLVLEVNAIGQQAVLTGDAGEIACRMVYGREMAPKCDVIQIPHHGTKASVAGFLAERLRPGVALISSKTPEEGLPAWNILHDRGVLALTTARSGAIQISLKGGRMSIRCFGDDKHTSD